MIARLALFCCALYACTHPSVAWAGPALFIAMLCVPSPSDKRSAP